MVKALVCAGVALVLGGFSGSGLQAQSAGSVGIDVGLFSPRSTFHDGSYPGNTFESAIAYGATATLWFDRSYVGIRGRLLITDVNGVNPNAPTAISENDPKILLLSSQLALRYPMEGASFNVSPYVAGGVGVKAYYWKRRVQAAYALTWPASIGVEIQPNSFGSLSFNVELSRIQSQFYFLGVERADPNDPNREGFYGGDIIGETNVDLMFGVGVAWTF